MHGLAIVAAFLFVPPVTVGVTELAGYGWGVDIASVLRKVVSWERSGKKPSKEDRPNRPRQTKEGGVPCSGRQCPLGRAIFSEVAKRVILGLEFGGGVIRAALLRDGGEASVCC